VENVKTVESVERNSREEFERYRRLEIPKREVMCRRELTPRHFLRKGIICIPDSIKDVWIESPFRRTGQSSDHGEG